MTDHRAAARRQQRAVGETDLEILDGLLTEAHGFRSAVLAAAPLLHLPCARAIMADFEPLFDDMIGDTLAGAHKAVSDHIDDNAPPPGPLWRAA